MKTFLMTAIAAIGFGSGAVACPNFNIQASEAYAASGAQLRAPKTFDVIAGGENYVWNCSNVRPGTDQGAGYFTSQPQQSRYRRTIR